MGETTRRQFIAGTSAAALGGAAMMPADLAAQTVKGDLPALVHVAYFWLKNPESVEDRNRLVTGLKTLAEVSSVKALHIGVPASTEKRDVVDNSFHVSEVMMFDNVEGQNHYQAHPIHKKFVESCEHLWARVVVHDSLAV